jgi:hypothetical protein
VNGDTRLYARTLKDREREAVQLVTERPGITLAEVQAHFELSDAAMRRLESDCEVRSASSCRRCPSPRSWSRA